MRDISPEQKPTREVMKLHLEAREVSTDHPDSAFFPDASKDRGHRLDRLQGIGWHVYRAEGNAALSIFHKPSEESRGEQGAFAKAP